MPKGNIRLTGTKLELVFTTLKGVEGAAQALARNDLSRPLAAVANDKLNGLEVEFDFVGGSPKKVRPVGQAFEPQTPAGPPQRGPQRGPQRQGPPQHRHVERAGPATFARPAGAFHNPYNFVRADETRDAADFKDDAPVGHDAFLDGKFTGRLTVTMTVETPLLLPDASQVKVDEKKHKTFPVRVDAAGQPLIAPTAVKGMLRAAYETITNSRFGVFAGHDDRLAYRSAARSGLRLVPVRVVAGPGGLRAELLPGDSGITPQGSPDGPMYAAWLPMYGGFFQRYSVKPYPGQAVWAYLTLWDHTNFLFFNVADIRDGADREPGDQPRDFRKPWCKARPTNERGFWVRGYVCITNLNIDNKHDERVFFTTRPQPPLLPLHPRVCDAWTELIRNYRDTHKDEIAKGHSQPSAMKNPDCVWSRHVTGQRDDEEERLHDGTLAYAEISLKPNGDGLQVDGLYPVMIARRLFAKPPIDMLPESLRPAATLGELSPADRVFGWANPDGDGAHRGQLRVGPIVCQSADAIHRFPEPGLPLAILSQPKPQQARFYLGNDTGNAQRSGAAKVDVAYEGTKKLRGRKVYPHHANLPDGYWREDAADHTQTAMDKHHQEYRRPGVDADVRDDQNRSVLGWVKRGATFEFDIHVTNLSPVELGALIWLLKLPANHYHRFGGGKPLGFGSVRLELTTNDLRDGEGWKAVYSSLDEPADAAADVVDLRAKFEKAVQDAKYADLLPAFLRAATGFADELPLHYPRVTAKPNPEGESFKWFVENERDGRLDRNLTLPNLNEDPGLPIFEVQPR